MVEDSPDDAQLIVDALASVVSREDIGLCRDGTSALEFFRCEGAYRGRNPLELPVFVLLDIKLPQVDGFDVLREIRSRATTRLLPVTVLSASDNQEDVRTAASLGANSYVRKPTQGRQLADILPQLARYWLELNVPPPLRGRQ